jgi:NADPH:quinone reductase-like Zn-dependent oxidoreductase
VALRGLVESGQVMPVIDHIFPLRDTAAAITYLHEGRARGKIVITLDGA